MEVAALKIIIGRMRKASQENKAHHVRKLPVEIGAIHVIGVDLEKEISKEKEATLANEDGGTGVRPAKGGIDGKEGDQGVLVVIATEVILANEMVEEIVADLMNEASRGTEAFLAIRVIHGIVDPTRGRGGDLEIGQKQRNKKIPGKEAFPVKELRMLRRQYVEGGNLARNG